MVTRIHAAVLLNLHSQVAYAVLSAPLSVCTKQQCCKACQTMSLPIVKPQRALANVNRRSCPHALLMLSVIILLSLQPNASASVDYQLRLLPCQ